MNDETAEEVALAVLTLAVTMRDEGEDAVRTQAAEVLAVAGGDSVAALTIAAALIRVDAPADPWWQDPTLPVTSVESHGTHAGYNRHRAHAEEPCVACWEGERLYQRTRQRRRRLERANR